jgi:hypothetical protein
MPDDKTGGRGESSGPATDRHNEPVIDPTANVLLLVEAAVRRQDDLRMMEASHMREVMEMRALHTKEMRAAEAKRIDAIRAVDVGAVATANQAAETRAATLAGQVAAAKDAQLVALKAETDPIRKDIGDLRQSQWTIAGGRDQVTETRAASGNWAVWLGLGVAVFAFLVSGFLSTMAIGVTIYIATR